MGYGSTTNAVSTRCVGLGNPSHIFADLSRRSDSAGGGGIMISRRAKPGESSYSLFPGRTMRCWVVPVIRGPLASYDFLGFFVSMLSFWSSASLFGRPNSFFGIVCPSASLPVADFQYSFLGSIQLFALGGRGIYWAASNYSRPFPLVIEKRE